jgi:hypothetical protein
MSATKSETKTPLCPVHTRIDGAGTLEIETGGNACVACSLNERKELLDILAPFAAPEGSEDSVTVMRRVSDFYQTHAGDGRVVVSYPAPAPTKSEAGWASEWPHKAGAGDEYYFVRRADRDDVVIMGFSMGKAWLNGVAYEPAEMRSHLFLGPLSPADAEQLVRLREAITNASLHNPPYNAGREYARGFARAKKLILGDLDAALCHALGTQEGEDKR